MTTAFIVLFPIFLVIFLLSWMAGRRRRLKAPLLPFWATVKNSYALAWAFRMEFLKISWGWLALSAPILFFYKWLTWSYMGNSCPDAHSLVTETTGRETRIFLLGSLQDILILPFGASIAVAWHRLILRGEKISKDLYLRFDRLVWNYFTLAFCILLVDHLPEWIGSFAGDESGLLWDILIMLIGSVVGCVTVVLVVRISVLLPARALALPAVTLKEAYRKTRYNFWRLSFGQSLCASPFIIIYLIVPVSCDGNLAGPLLSTIHSLLGVILVAPVFLTFLSLAYRHFFEENAPSGQG